MHKLSREIQDLVFKPNLRPPSKLSTILFSSPALPLSLPLLLSLQFSRFPCCIFHICSLEIFMVNQFCTLVIYFLCNCGSKLFRLPKSTFFFWGRKHTLVLDKNIDIFERVGFEETSISLVSGSIIKALAFFFGISAFIVLCVQYNLPHFLQFLCCFNGFLEYVEEMGHEHKSFFVCGLNQTFLPC